MTEFKEGAEKNYSFQDLTHVAEKIRDGNVLPPDSREYYLDEQGILKIRSIETI